MSKENLIAAKKKAGVISDYQIFNTPQGRNVLKDLMKNHHFIGPVFDSDPQQMARNEGERNVVLRILHNLQTDATKVLKYLEEIDRENKGD